MPVLNFLRYLLIRDKQESNRVGPKPNVAVIHISFVVILNLQTGIWGEPMKSDVQNKFISPLREMLVMARAQSRQELDLKTEEGKRGREQGASDQGGPELNVEVMGATLPKISIQDEINVRTYHFLMSDLS